VVRSSRDGADWEAAGPVPGTVLAFAAVPGAEGAMWALALAREKRGEVALKVLSRADFGWRERASFAEPDVPHRFPTRGLLRVHPADTKRIRAFVTDLDDRNVTLVLASPSVAVSPFVTMLYSSAAVSRRERQPQHQPVLVFE